MSVVLKQVGSKPIKSFTRSNLPVSVCLDSISTASSFETVEGIDSTTVLSFSDQLLADLEGMEKGCPQARGRKPWGKLKVAPASASLAELFPTLTSRLQPGH